MRYLNVGEACGPDCMADNGCHGDDRDLCPRCAERREELADDEAEDEDETEGGEQ